jgi:glycosyltransferase involved in cell wall biosynthesis
MVVYAEYPFSETRVQREAEALVEAGWEVDVLCLRTPGEPDRDSCNGVAVHRLPVDLDKRSLALQLASWTWFLVRAAARLTALHRRRAYDTVQVHNLPDYLVFAAAVPKASGATVVLDLHDLLPEFFAGRFGTERWPWLARLVRLQERLSCRFADHVITVTDQWRDRLVERGVPADTITVVMNVADGRVFRPVPRPPDDGDGPSVIYHGTVTERYGLDLALRAVDMLRDELPGLHLTIRGGGDFVDDLHRLRAELDLEDRVDLVHTLVPLEDLPGIIGSHDLAVVPNRNDEFTDGILPTKLMEYAAVGIPAVAARTSAIEAYFADANVELFEPGDAADLARGIRALAVDSARRRELAARSHVFTDRHDWQAVRAGYVALMERLRG